MNFVLHHHLAARDLGVPAAAAGAMLPDLWRMADRRVHVREADGAGEDEAVRHVLAGIVHHVEADKWFHRAPAFVDGERAAREALRTSRAPRIGLFAHITWEMCLDGALLRRVGLERAVGELRDAVAAARPLAHRRAAELHHFAQVARTAEERATFEARTDRILDEVVRGPWIAGYRTGDGVAERLGGVRARLGFPAFEPSERAAVASAVDALAERADAAVTEIVTRAPPC